MFFLVLEVDELLSVVEAECLIEVNFVHPSEDLSSEPSDFADALAYPAGIGQMLSISKFITLLNVPNSKISIQISEDLRPSVDINGGQLLPCEL